MDFNRLQIPLLFVLLIFHKNCAHISATMCIRYAYKDTQQANCKQIKEYSVHSEQAVHEKRPFDSSRAIKTEKKIAFWNRFALFFLLLVLYVPTSTTS